MCVCVEGDIKKADSKGRTTYLFNLCKCLATPNIKIFTNFIELREPLRLQKWRKLQPCRYNSYLVHYYELTKTARLVQYLLASPPVNFQGFHCILPLHLEKLNFKTMLVSVFAFTSSLSGNQINSYLVN